MSQVNSFQIFSKETNLRSLFSAFDSKTSMRCYSEKTGPKYQICDKSFGFQTCFTKYDDSKFLKFMNRDPQTRSNSRFVSENQVVLRGCSSKRKMFHIECESHLSGTRNSLDSRAKLKLSQNPNFFQGFHSLWYFSAKSKLLCTEMSNFVTAVMICAIMPAKLCQVKLK